MYEWLKALHILAVISWMAGLLYLPRLMVYHVDAVVDGTEDRTFKTMERRLLKAIMRPAALVAVLTGLSLFHLAGFDGGDSWVVVKLMGVLGLLVVHGVLERHVAQLARGQRFHSGRYFRILNEVPTVLMVVVVVMVVVKPWS
jgi:putative membrane protein